MCQWCEQLTSGNRLRCLREDENLDRAVQKIFQKAYHFLDEKSGGSLRQELEWATNNLARMYEWDAPEFLIQKAHSVQRQRLRSYRGSIRANAASERRSSELRQRFSLIRGDKS
jgi:hypothetical protein